VNRDALVDRLALPTHEGLRLKPYTDTVGKLTIGIGRNLSDDGISAAEAKALCLADVIEAEAELDRHAAWWRNMDETRQQVLAELAFMLGWPRLSGFHQMLGKLEVGNTAGAAEELLNSHLAAEIPARARLLAAALRTGAFV
jgi:lysozyme